jgi:hypothetical protein
MEINGLVPLLGFFFNLLKNGWYNILSGSRKIGARSGQRSPGKAPVITCVAEPRHIGSYGYGFGSFPWLILCNLKKMVH